jgi:hypothetical protein
MRPAPSKSKTGKNQGIVTFRQISDNSLLQATKFRNSRPHPHDATLTAFFADIFSIENLDHFEK